MIDQSTLMVPPADFVERLISMHGDAVQAHAIFIKSEKADTFLMQAPYSWRNEVRNLLLSKQGY